MTDTDSKKIDLLIVDDEADFRAAAGQALGRRGFDVREAHDGAQALERIEERVPDVVLLDLRMEGMNGMDVLARIREKHHDLPVVILTGHGGFDEAVQGIHLHVSDFVQKPVDMERLAEQLRRLLISDRGRPLAERTVGDIMVPISSYRRVYSDQTLADAVASLVESFAISIHNRTNEKGHRSVVVVDRTEAFVDVLHLADVIGAVIPGFIKGTPYGSAFTGMFLAQTKVTGRTRIGDILDDRSEESLRIEAESPLMEAANLMHRHRAINLPVFDRGKLVGILRDKDLLLEIARSIS